MLPLLLALVLFFFLAVGAAVFVVCVVIAPLRRFGLAAALWCAAWGPWTVAWMIFGGLVLVVDGFALQHGKGFVPAFSGRGAWMAAGLMAVTAIPFATIVTWVHQVIVDRTTFALFRLYATVVITGIGGVFGICVGWWMLAYEHAFIMLWPPSVICLMGLFGYLGYRGASQLRGQPPTRFNWVSPEEFYGSDRSSS